MTVIALAAASAVAVPYTPPVPNGECKRAWRRQGFSAGAEDPKLRTLFVPDGSESYDAFYRRLDRASCWKQWLVVIYMQADNDLSAFAWRDLWEMEAAGSFPSVDVVAFHAPYEGPARYVHVAKHHGQPDYREELAAFVRENHLEEREEKDQEIAYLEKKGPTLVASPVLKTLKADAASPDTLGDFLSWAFERYPSRRVILIGWGHGKGFDISPGAVPPADTDDLLAPQPEPAGKPGNPMPVVGMVAEIKRQLERHRAGRSLDVAGSDSCLNQQVEYGYEWRGIADYAFGSSTIVQRKGFNYRVLLKWFGEHPEVEETIDLAREIPRLYGGSVTSGSGRKYSSYYDPWATMAVWTTGELPVLKDSLNTLGASLSAWIDGGGTPIEKVKRLRQLKEQIAKSLRLGGTSNDLYNLVLTLGAWARDAGEPTLVRALNGVGDALNRTVLAKHIGKKYLNHLVLASKGVALWLPSDEDEYQRLIPKFRHSRFYTEAPSWSRLVERLYGD